MRIRNHFIQQKARVELLPLIDVVFLLLVFFIYVMLSMSLHKGIDIQLPETGNAVIEQNVIVVSITASGNLEIDGKPVILKKLAQTVNGRIQSTKSKVLIRGDSKSDLGVAINVLDILSSAGIEQVGFAVSQKTNSP